MSGTECIETWENAHHPHRQRSHSRPPVCPSDPLNVIMTDDRQFVRQQGSQPAYLSVSRSSSIPRRPSTDIQSWFHKATTADRHKRNQPESNCPKIGPNLITTTKMRSRVDWSDCESHSNNHLPSIFILWSTETHRFSFLDFWFSSTRHLIDKSIKKIPLLTFPMRGDKILLIDVVSWCTAWLIVDQQRTESREWV